MKVWLDFKKLVLVVYFYTSIILDNIHIHIQYIANFSAAYSLKKLVLRDFNYVEF